MFNVWAFHFVLVLAMRSANSGASAQRQAAFRVHCFLDTYIGLWISMFRGVGFMAVGWGVL